MASPQRLEKLNVLVKEELSKILDREFESDRALLTITKVDISPDVHYATVFVSLLGNDPKGALEVLQKNVYSTQQMLNRKVKMRPVPRIRFRIDEGEFRREKVEKTIAGLKKKNEI